MIFIIAKFNLKTTRKHYIIKEFEECIRKLQIYLENLHEIDLIIHNFLKNDLNLMSEINKNPIIQDKFEEINDNIYNKFKYSNLNSNQIIIHKKKEIPSHISEQDEYQKESSSKKKSYYKFDVDRKPSSKKQKK